jgi:hypothetical protein
VLRKKVIAIAAAFAIGIAAVPISASAQWHGSGGWHGGGWHGGGWHGGGWHGGGWNGGGWGYYGGGFAAGAIIGGLLAAPYYYGYGPYYGYYPAPAYYYGPPPGGAVAYCMRRFRTYDPRTGTYVGYDGYRHPCP